MLGSTPHSFVTSKCGNEVEHPEKGEGHGIIPRRSQTAAGEVHPAELCSLMARLCHQIPLHHLPAVCPSLPSVLPSFLLHPHFASLTLLQ